MTSGRDGDISTALARLRAALATRPALTTVDLLGEQFDCGLAWPHFAVGFGGLGLAGDAARAAADQVGALGLPPTRADFVAFHQVARVIHDSGSAQQRARLLRRIFTGADHWCQLFSEPGAGSDLAGLATRARRDGDTFVVDGQKVWTSGARHATHALLLARTDPAVVKHAGMTMFVLDMQAAGVSVRPLRQADGGARFSEVFLDGVRVEDAMRVGPVGAGWAMAMAVLGTERTGASDVFLRPVDELVELCRALPDSVARKSDLRDDVVRVWIEAHAVAATKERLATTEDERERVVLTSLAKIAASEHAQRLADVLSAVVGPEVLVHADYDRAEAHDHDARSAAGVPDLSALSPTRYQIRARAMSIEGGTNEIQRNVIGERVLGLPPDIRVDKDRPWQEIPRA